MDPANNPPTIGTAVEPAMRDEGFRANLKARVDAILTIAGLATKPVILFLYAIDINLSIADKLCSI